jgi:hypothetical protein
MTELFEVRNEDGQVISTHKTNAEAQSAAQTYRMDRDAALSACAVFGPVAESSRQ